MNPLLFPEDTSFWYETQRTLGHTAYGGADIGEVLATAQAITGAITTAGTTSGWPPPTGLPPKPRKCSPADTASARATGSCGPTITTGPPSSTCTAIPTIPVSTTPTTGRGSASTPRLRSSTPRSSRSKSLMRKRFCAGTSIGAPEVTKTPPHARRSSCTVGSTARAKSCTGSAPPPHKNVATTCSPSTDRGNPRRAASTAWSSARIGRTSSPRCSTGCSPVPALP